MRDILDRRIDEQSDCWVVGTKGAVTLVNGVADGLLVVGFEGRCGG